MGIVDSQSGPRSAKKGRRHSKRIGFHLDMTPMVDVAFLLLTFFMLTTTFSKSNTMEITQTKKGPSQGGPRSGHTEKTVSPSAESAHQSRA